MRKCWNCRYCDRYKGQSICILMNNIVDINMDACGDWKLHPSIASSVCDHMNVWQQNVVIIAVISIMEIAQ